VPAEFHHRVSPCVRAGATWCAQSPCGRVDRLPALRFAVVASMPPMVTRSAAFATGRAIVHPPATHTPGTARPRRDVARVLAALPGLAVLLLGAACGDAGSQTAAFSVGADDPALGPPNPADSQVLGPPKPTSTTAGTATGTPTGTGTTTPTGTGTGTTPPNPGPGPGPSAQCNLQGDADGFIQLQSGASDYWMRLPVGYNKAAPAAYPLVVSAHGCGDSAKNHLSWAVSPYELRATQAFIGISVGGRDGQCWTLASDENLILKALAHARTCAYGDQRKIFMAGYSSGGMLAYYTGLRNSALFAGILALKTGVGDRNLISGATAKPRVAAFGGAADTYFPAATYRGDWAALRAAGFTVVSAEDGSPHDGSADEWRLKLLPYVTQWSK
jgi:poly(3-hydroxybutyrate) depolymerase